MDKELKREIILEHFSNPINKVDTVSDNYKLYNTRNPNCIDNLDIYILIEDNIIKDIKFNGEACSISTASTSIMIKNLIGKTIKSAREYINNFDNMINELEYDESILNEGLCFNEIYKQNNRKNCALLPYKGIIKAIDDYER
jgi:nitrogen fixation protein NifU and related proteins